MNSRNFEVHTVDIGAGRTVELRFDYRRGGTNFATREEMPRGYYAMARPGVTANEMRTVRLGETVSIFCQDATRFSRRGLLKFARLPLSFAMLAEAYRGVVKEKSGEWTLPEWDAIADEVKAKVAKLV